MPVLHIPFFYIGSVHFPRWFHTFIYFSVWFPVARAFFFYPLTISSFVSPHRFGAICFYSMSAAPSSASTLLSCPPRSSLYSLFFTFFLFCFVCMKLYSMPPFFQSWRECVTGSFFFFGLFDCLLNEWVCDIQLYCLKRQCIVCLLGYLTVYIDTSSLNSLKHQCIICLIEFITVHIFTSSNCLKNQSICLLE